jgi:hypothetical protein
MVAAFKPLADAATAVAEKMGMDLPPTLDEMIENYVEDQEGARLARVNVFSECIRKDRTVAVETEAQASEIARLMNNAESELENTKAVAAAMVRKAEARVSALDFIFKAALECWTSVKLVGKKGRSLILPGGKLSLRKVPTSTHYVDDKETLQWALLNLPSAVEMVPKLKLDVLKEWEAANDKAAPGRERTPEHDSFKVSIPK